MRAPVLSSDLVRGEHKRLAKRQKKSGAEYVPLRQG
jgi:hypothetical protein